LVGGEGLVHAGSSRRCPHAEAHGGETLNFLNAGPMLAHVSGH
jgi:hypothetical protein